MPRPRARLFETQRAGSFAVLNADDPDVRGLRGAHRRTPLWFSSTRAVTPGVWLADGKIWFDGELLMEAGEVPIRGRHNVENTMAAAAAARLAGASLGADCRGGADVPGGGASARIRAQV